MFTTNVVRKNQFRLQFGHSFGRRDLNACVERCGLTDPPEKLMCLADLPGSREVMTAAATAEVPDDKPAICGTVTLHCLDEEEPLRLSMPMLDALLLLNSLRAIEQEFGLQAWSAQIGCSLNGIEEVAQQLRQTFTDDGLLPSITLN
jgi:hypothetical protein